MIRKLLDHVRPSDPRAMKLRLNITPKLALIFVLFAAVLLAGVSALADSNGRAALQVATTSDLLSTAIEKQAALDGWVEERQADIATLVASPQVRADLAAMVAARDPAAARAAHDRLITELEPMRQGAHTWICWPCKPGRRASGAAIYRCA